MYGVSKMEIVMELTFEQKARLTDGWSVRNGRIKLPGTCVHLNNNQRNHNQRTTVSNFILE